MEHSPRHLVSLIVTAIFFVTIGCGGSSTNTPPPPNNPSPTVTFSANSNSISSGQTVTLTWQAANATSVTITAAAGGASRTVTTSSQLSGSVNDTPTQTTVYTAVATGASGSGSSPQSVTVNVAQPVAPQITSFTASPGEVGGGQSTTVTWATTNATSVDITPPVIPIEDGVTLPTSGSATTPVSATTTYTITASGPGGNATQTLTVGVPFTVSLSVTPATVTPGQSATVSWQIVGGTAAALTIDNSICASCTLPQGSTTVTPAATTTYTATATAADGTLIKQTVTATVSSPAAGVIKHIFFMLQENRSFDMYLGQLGPYRTNRLAQLGITDTQTVDGFDPNVSLLNHHTGVHIKPFHQATTCTENLTPSWDESHHDTALTGGDPAWNTTSTFTNSSFAMNNFEDTTGSVPQNFDPNGTRAMGFYNQQDLPYYYDLATFFATSDTWHSPVLANTYPNRFYLMTGTSFGHEYPDGDASHPKYAAKTIFHAMNDANVSWLYYHSDSGIFLGQFQDFADPKISGRTFPISDLLSRLSGTCSGTPCNPDTALPEVIFIDSPSSTALDEHPGSDHNVQKGAAFVQSIISALMNSPAWKDSVFILSYDEGGGLYDHVPPFSVPAPDNIAPGQCPDPNNGSFGYCHTGVIGGTFNLTGFRVPVIVISPFAKPHYVSHVPRDYTAILAFIEKTFNVPNLTQRDLFFQDPSRDMNEFFDFTAPNLLNAPGGVPWTQFLPTQPTSEVCDPTKEAGPTF